MWRPLIISLLARRNNSRARFARWWPHRVENRFEAAYRRGDLFEKRRDLMAHWADFVVSGRAVSER